MGRTRRLAGSCLVLAVLVGVLAAGVQGREPEKERQLVFGISAWDGEKYSGTFSARMAPTFYLLADTDNVINTAYTDVYFWAITGEYNADWMGVREDVEANMEVYRGDQLVRVVERQRYVYAYPDGVYNTGNVKLLVGKAAEAEHERFRAAMDAFFDAQRKYFDEETEYRRQLDALLKRVQETGVTASPEEIPPAPVRPEPPTFFVTQPREAIILNLPVGEYRVRLVDGEGKPVPDGERRLEVFTHRREGVIYQIIPEEKWTRPVDSPDLSRVLYVDGARTVFLKPFVGQEYNRFHYNKMTRLQAPLAGEGSRGSWQWVRAGELTGPALQILRDGRVVAEVVEKPYFVEQTPGYALGYNIIDFDPEEPRFADRRPSFTAYKVSLEPSGQVQMRLVDSAGNVIPGSERHIRSIRPDSAWALYGTPFFPFVLGLGVFAWRRSLGRSRGPDIS